MLKSNLHQLANYSGIRDIKGATEAILRVEHDLAHGSRVPQTGPDI